MIGISNGSNGLHEDYKQAYVWCSKAADLNSVRGMAYKGVHLYMGRGVDEDKVAGAALLGVAAGKDNAYACYFLGDEYYGGDSGLPKDHKLAKYWLRKALDLNQDDEKDTGFKLADEAIKTCEAILEKLARE